jgi:hypothetical protein
LIGVCGIAEVQTGWLGGTPYGPLVKAVHGR